MNIDFSVHNLSNNLRVLLVPKENTELIAIQIHIKVGSMDDGKQYGKTHFLEHLLFQNKNTERLFRISLYGGQINAATYKDNLSIYIVGIKFYFYEMLELILSILFDFEITQEDVEKECKVIREEILGSLNAPGRMWDMFTSLYWKSGEVRIPITGTVESVGEINRDDILTHYLTYVTPNNMVISVAGGIDKKQILEYLEGFFKNRLFSFIERNSKYSCIEMEKNYIKQACNLSSSHIFAAFACPVYGSEEMPPVSMAVRLLGDGSYSRLYRELREKRSLVYTVTSKIMAYKEVSCLLFYIKCRPDNENAVIDLMLDNINCLKSGGVKEEELFFLRNQYNGNLLRKIESTAQLLNMLGIELLLTGTIVDFQTSRERFQSVNQQVLKKICNKYFCNPKIIVIGK